MPCRDGCGLCNVVIKNLTVKKGTELLLDNISFSLKCGELTALIGENGAGKTTLLRAILGETEHEGSITHEDCTGEKLPKVTIGYVPQHLHFDTSSPVSVYDFLSVSRTAKPVCFFPGKKKSALRQDIDECLGKVGAQELGNRTLGQLSGGELQKVMLAGALYPTPELLILDEPVSGVDYSATENFYKIIDELRKTTHLAIAMVSHDLDLVKRYADKVILLKKQVLSIGTPEQVYSSAQFKKTFFVSKEI